MWWGLGNRNRRGCNGQHVDSITTVTGMQVRDLTGAPLDMPRPR
ncbi:hypothetical protein C7S15_4537 [Burkholderia cepacia]|nr:hypothetical protein [Burkholderia cepacia]